jgi:MFS family permease
MLQSRSGSRDSTRTLSGEERVPEIPWYESPYYNIILLSLSWACCLSSSTLLTTIGPLTAKSLHGSDTVATFTIGTFLIGAALSSVPSSYLFKNFGRHFGFQIGCVNVMCGSICGYLAIDSTDVGLLLLGCTLSGFGQGLGQFYRFSATEMTPDELKPRAVTYVLAGGIIAAVMGPLAAQKSSGMFQKEYQGSFAIQILIAVLNSIFIYLVRYPKLDQGKGCGFVFNYKALSSSDNGTNREDEEEERDEEDGDNDHKEDDKTNLLPYGPRKNRKLYEIIKQPLFIVSCIIPTIAHTMMVMLMSSVSLAMEKNGFEFEKTSLVMTLHFLAMFLPGFVTGSLIVAYGALVVSIFGGLLFASSTIVMDSGETFYNYAIGMILCGVGWNFSFSAGTVMLMGSYRPDEATKVQAFNDFVLFSIAGAGSLISGLIFALYGWHILCYAITGVVVLNMVFFLIAWRIKKQLENLRTASTLFDDLAPVLDESLDLSGQGNNKSPGRTKSDNNPLHGGQRGGDLTSTDAIEEEERRYGDLQVPITGVEWWNKIGESDNKAKSFSVFGRFISTATSATDDSRDSQEMTLRSASVI